MSKFPSQNMVTASKHPFMSLRNASQFLISAYRDWKCTPLYRVYIIPAVLSDDKIASIAEIETWKSLGDIMVAFECLSILPGICGNWVN